VSGLSRLGDGAADGLAIAKPSCRSGSPGQVRLMLGQPQSAGLARERRVWSSRVARPRPYVACHQNPK